MTAWRETKFRDDETWAAVRRAWEDGETAASCARRFDVGLANLWRRRASEGWSRERPEDPTPEPVEGWTRYAARKQAEFERRLEDERATAECLLAAMSGGPIGDVPLWHLGFVLAWRAARSAPEVGAGDRELNAGQPWAAAIWGPDGTIRPQAVMDLALARLHREEWRREAGLPDGAAEGWP